MYNGVKLLLCIKNDNTSIQVFWDQKNGKLYFKIDQTHTYFSYACYLIADEEFYFLCQLQFTVRSLFIAHVNYAVGTDKLKTAIQMSINLFGVLVEILCLFLDYLTL